MGFSIGPGGPGLNPSSSTHRCVTLGKLLNLPVPQLFSYKMGMLLLDS